MAHIQFNHLNASAFNSFVPKATKTSNNQFFKNALIVGGIAIGIWIIYELRQSKKEEIKDVQE
jgi:hypothetical protein